MNSLKIFLIIAATMLSGFAKSQQYLESSDIYSGKAEVKASVRVTLKPGFRAMRGGSVRVWIDPSASYTAVNYAPSAGTAIGQSSPSSSMNYLRTTILLEKESLETNISSRQRVEKVEYINGLGNPVQSVVVQGSPGRKDIIQHKIYDRFGREQLNYLPYAAGTNTGAFVPTAAIATENFYRNGFTGREAADSAYAEILYENSPMNRVTGEKGEGKNWKMKPSTVEYQVNTAQIQHWKADQSSFIFSPGELYVTITTDEDGNISREYKDKSGKVVRIETVADGQNLATSYVYDDFDLLKIVVPPKATGPGDTELCFFYNYDKRKRMTEKKIPGADWVYMVYDKRDRLVMVQDGNNRYNSNGTLKNEWVVTHYDALNRPVSTGTVINSTAIATIRTAFDNFTGTLYETWSKNGTLYGYSNTGIPSGYRVTKANVLTVTYYDSYSFLTHSDFSGGGYGYTTPHLASNPSTPSFKTKGLITGTLVKVLPNNDVTVTDNLLLSVSYFDDFGRSLRIISDNHLGGKDIAYSKYNFTGQPEQTALSHTTPGNPEIRIISGFTYDHQGRVLTEKLQAPDATEITLTSNQYNEIGELVSKYNHGTAAGGDFNQKTDYTYNIKGWLRTINQPGNLGTDLFALDLRYENQDNSVLASGQFYNGNISEMRWQTSGNTPKGYGFNYDNGGRLSSSSYADGTSFNSNTGKYNTGYSYDKNGNMATLNRNYNGMAIDQLSYSYENSGRSNRLLSVTDQVANTGVFDGYRKYTSGTYSYDKNGSMIYDPSKGILLVYNRLNLPEKVTFSANDFIGYVYEASGRKLVKKVSGTTSQNVSRTDYSGNFLYEDNKLKCIFTSAGRLIPVKSNGSVLWKVEYNLTDHLGNVRAVFAGHANGRPELMQATDYYPFGMVMAQQSFYADTLVPNRYLYNGKEIQNDQLAGTSMGWYDYGARMYDAVIGRWHVVDPLSEKWLRTSPYIYAVNNPLRFIDPDGREMTDFKEKDGKIFLHVEDGSNAVFQLKGTNQNNEYFGFTGEYNNQGGKNEISIQGALAGAQDYVTNNYTKCNQSVNFVGRTYESATKAQGKTVPNIEIINGNSFSSQITKDFASKVSPEKSITSAQESAGKGNLVVGANGGHVVTMTTKTFDITRFNISGSIIEKKQIIGGLTTNVNGRFRTTNIGPGQLNSFQNPKYSMMTWYSLPFK